MPLGGYATGVLVESHMGRPTMVEGNEKHPDSLGAIDPFDAGGGAHSLRPRPLAGGQPPAARSAPGTTSCSTAAGAIDAQRPKKGAGVRILTETVTSPTLARQLRGLIDEFPEAKWHQYEPAGGDHARAGARLAFGEDVAVRYHFDKADVILALDADFLVTCPGRLCYARDFAARREPQGGKMNRLYAVEPAPTITGAMADHRLALASHQIAGLAAAIAQKLGVKVSPPDAAAARGAAALDRRGGGRPREEPRGEPGRGGRDASRPSFMPWRTRSTRPWATSARRSSISPRSRPSPSIRWRRSARWSATWRRGGSSCS